MGGGGRVERMMEVGWGGRKGRVGRGILQTLSSTDGSLRA